VINIAYVNIISSSFESNTVFVCIFRLILPMSQYQHKHRQMMALTSGHILSLCMVTDGWDSGFYPGRTGGTKCSSDVHKTQLTSSFPLTVKELLLSGTSEPVSDDKGYACVCVSVCMCASMRVSVCVSAWMSASVMACSYVGECVGVERNR
jgi:hypothetical protein